MWAVGSLGGCEWVEVYKERLMEIEERACRESCDGGREACEKESDGEGWRKEREYLKL